MAIYLGKELSTRNRMVTLQEALTYFENMNNAEAVNEVKEIIRAKSEKKKAKVKEEKEDRKVKVSINPEKGTCTKVSEDIENYEPDEQLEVTSNGIKSNLISLSKISKGIQEQAVTMYKDEVRSCVDFYYQIQNFRMATDNQLRSIEQNYDVNVDTESISLMKWNAMQLKNIEKNNKLILEKFSDSTKVTRWMKSVKGVGPVIAACLYAYLNIDDINSAGNFWSYAGLNDNNNPWL